MKFIDCILISISGARMLAPTMLTANFHTSSLQASSQLFAFASASSYIGKLPRSSLLSDCKSGQISVQLGEERRERARPLSSTAKFSKTWLQNQDQIEEKHCEEFAGSSSSEFQAPFKKVIYKRLSASDAKMWSGKVYTGGRPLSCISMDRHGHHKKLKYAWHSKISWKLLSNYFTILDFCWEEFDYMVAL